MVQVRVQKERSKINRRLPWSGPSDCLVCHRTVSGAPGWINSNSSPSGFWKNHSAIIHRTVRCNTGLSCVPAEQRLQRNGQLQRKPEKRYSARTVRIEVRAAPEGAPDSEQYRSGAPPDCPVAQAIRVQRSNPNGWVTWLAHRTVFGGAPDCPVRPSTAAQPQRLV
jgi:hypothetical protein